MSTIIVSYDGTANDDDALALGRLLAGTGATLELAYVRHSREFDPGREEIAQHDAERRLALGAAWLQDPDLPQHIVISASTGEGLGKLAESEGASLIVFGSDYRTPPGRVEPGTSAQHLLEGGTIAVAVAPAGLRTHADASIESIALASLGWRVRGTGNGGGARREARRHDRRAGRAPDRSDRRRLAERCARRDDRARRGHARSPRRGPQRRDRAAARQAGAV